MGGSRRAQSVNVVGAVDARRRRFGDDLSDAAVGRDRATVDRESRGSTGLRPGESDRGEAALSRSRPEVRVRPVRLDQTRPLRQAVLRPHETLDQLAGSEPADAFAVGACDGHTLIAVGFVAPDGGPASWRVRGMATAPVARGRGVGAAVLAALVGHATAHGARRVWCNARTPARSLYERAGFRVVSDEFELPDIGPHLVMELTTMSIVRNPASDAYDRLGPS
jgi:ribosomal protein S18 acetylase RimI-like enzyme